MEANEKFMDIIFLISRCFNSSGSCRTDTVETVTIHFVLETKDVDK